MALDEKPETNQEFGTFNPIAISDSGKVRNKPISTFYQAHAIYSRFEKDNLARSMRNKIVDDKYNLMPPLDNNELRQTGQHWRANFHTGFIGSVNDRVSSRLTDMIHTMKYLTNSRIPDSWPESDTKTMRFRERITDTIRAWIGFNDFTDQLTREVSYFGYGAAIWLGQYEWRPQSFRQDEMYFDEHSRQNASELPVFCVRKSYYPYQLVELMAHTNEEDNANNESMGYRVRNISAAVRAATAPILRPFVDIRLLSDIVREGSLYYTYHQRVRVIETVHLYCQNYDGGIDHWWFNRKRDAPARAGQDTTQSEADREGNEESKRDEEDDNDPIGFLQETLDDQAMSDFITLFTFQAGNNRLFGSKGVGRMLANHDSVINRSRMAMIDSAFVGGLMVGKTSESTMARMIPTVRFPFMWVPEGVEMLAQQFQTNIQNWVTLDNSLKSMAETIVGAYLPDQIQMPGEMPETATAEAIDAQREEEAKQGTLNRFWRQFTEMVQTIQKRICNATNIQLAIDIMERRKKLAQAAATGKGKMKFLVPSQLYEQMMIVSGDPSDMYDPMPKMERGDQDAVDCILLMLEDGLSPAEIIAAAHSKSTEPTQLTTAKEIVQFQQFYQAMREIMGGNPNFNWAEMDRVLSEQNIGVALTKEVYVGDQGQQENVEQQRLQLMETGTIMGGEQVPVSNRDNHMVHLSTIMPQISTQIQGMKQMPPVQIPDQQIQSVSRQIDHAKMHVAGLQQQGKQSVPPKVIAQAQNQIQDGIHELALMQQAKMTAMALAMAMQQREQAAAMSQPFEPEETQVGPNGQPPPNAAQIEQLKKNNGQAVGALHRDKRT